MRSLDTSGWSILEALVSLTILLSVISLLNSHLTSQIRLWRETEARTNQVLVAKSVISQSAPAIAIELQRGAQRYVLEKNCAGNSNIPVPQNLCSLKVEEGERVVPGNSIPPLRLIYPTLQTAH